MKRLFLLKDQIEFNRQEGLVVHILTSLQHEEFCELSKVVK